MDPSEVWVLQSNMSDGMGNGIRKSGRVTAKQQTLRRNAAEERMKKKRVVVVVVFETNSILMTKQEITLSYACRCRFFDTTTSSIVVVVDDDCESFVYLQPFF